METGLRIVLLLVAFFILAGIIWDALISRQKKSNVYKRNNANKFDRKKIKKAKALFEKDDPFSEYSQNPFKDEAFDEADPLQAELEESDDKHFDARHFDARNFDDKYSDAKQRISSQTDFDEVYLVKPRDTKETKRLLPDVKKRGLLESGSFENKSFENKSIENKSMENLEIEPEQNKAKGIPNDVMILNLMARQPGVFSGRKMLEAFQEAHLYFGEMSIFHRHENMDGSGQIMFSLASAVEPGIFQISKIETFVTPGLTLFFVLEKPNQSIAAFELMLRTAKQLAMRLDGEIKDSQHKYLTLPTIEKYRERARNAGMTAVA